MGSGACKAAPTAAPSHNSRSEDMDYHSGFEEPGLTPTSNKKGAAWSRNFQHDQDSDDGGSPQAASSVATISEIQRGRVTQIFEALTLNNELTCQRASEELTAIGITDAEMLVEQVHGGMGGPLSSEEWAQMFEAVGAAEPDMLDALIMGCSQAVAMELHREEAIRVYKKIDPMESNSVPFEASQEELLQMGAPEVFLEMYQTMMELYMDETGGQIEAGVSMDQWLEVLGSVAYNPGALDWLQLPGTKDEFAY